MRIRLRVVPNAPKTEIVGAYGEGLKVKVKAPPLDGKANEELVKFFAKHHGISRNSVRIITGDTSRDKLIEIDLPEGAPK